MWIFLWAVKWLSQSISICHLFVVRTKDPLSTTSQYIEQKQSFCLFVSTALPGISDLSSLIKDWTHTHWTIREVPVCYVLKDLHTFFHSGCTKLPSLQPPLQQSFIYFGCTAWLVGSQFPDRGLNLGPNPVKAPNLTTRFTPRTSPSLS